MWFNLVMFLAFLAVWYFQFLQGAYSALIMTLLTVVSVCATFEMYEVAAAYFNYDFLAGYQYGIGFLLTFSISLAVLRMLYDTFAPANMYFQTYVDRPIAGVFGLLTGLLVSGMLSIGFQMLPFGPEILMFDRVGLLSQPLDAEQKTDVTDIKRVRQIQKAMEFTAEHAKGLQRKMWFNQDEIAFGLYRRLLSDNNMISSDRKVPKDHFGQEIDSAEFLARCWDWRVQHRFAVTPIGLRVPFWAVTEKANGEYRRDTPTEKRPVQMVRAVKLSPNAYQKINVGEPPVHNHVLVSVQIPRGAGVNSWYMAHTDKGGIRKNNQFPPVVPTILARRLGQDKDAGPDDPPDEFASFAYWQMKLVAFNQKNESKEYPLRAVFGLSVAETVTEGGGPGSGSKGRTIRKARADFTKEIVQASHDNVPTGNISVLTFPRSGEVLQFRLLFFIEKDYDKRVQLVYTAVPPDTSLLGIDARRKETLEWKSPARDPMPLGNLNDPLVDDQIVRTQ